MRDDLQKIFDSIPDKFKIVEKEIKFEIQQEYIELSKRNNIDNLQEINISGLKTELFDSKTEPNKIKETIVMLGNIGSIESLKILQEYYEKSIDGLKPLIRLSIQENIMFLENEFDDEPIGMILSGLGGKNNKLRYYFVIISQTEESFTKHQKRLIEIEYDLICKQYNTEIEKIDFKNDYAEIIILMPLNVALDTVVMEGMKKCNEFGNFIVEFYYTTNVEIPNIEELQKIIKEELRG